MKTFLTLLFFLNSMNVSSKSITADDSCESNYNYRTFCTKVKLEKIQSSASLSGGDGSIFTSTLPEKLGGIESYFYKIDNLPKNAMPNSKMSLYRYDHILKALEDILLTSTVVVTEIPIGTGVKGAALDGPHQLVKDTAKVCDSSINGVLIITPEVDMFTLQHEAFHMLDFRDNLPGSIRSELNVFFEKVDLDEELSGYFKDGSLVQFFTQMVIEIRAHSFQAQYARKILTEGLPFATSDNDGTLLTESLERRKSSEFQEKQAYLNFIRAYGDSVRSILSKFTSINRAKLINVLSKYALDDSRNKLTFEYFL